MTLLMHWYGLIRSTRWNAWQSFIKAIVGWCNSNNYSLWTSVPKLTGCCSPLHQTWVKKSDSLLFWCVVWECSLFCKVAYKQISGIACAWIKQKHIPVLTDFTKGLLKHKMSSCSESNTVDTNTVTYHKNVQAVWLIAVLNVFIQSHFFLLQNNRFFSCAVGL